MKLSLYTRRRGSRKSGFTLVEILIVVIILGILAAIVIPQFSNASADARDANLRSQLHSIRNQIQMYKMQHGDRLPDLVSGWDALTQTSTYNGKTCGPYLKSVPVNPLNNLSNVADGNGTGAAGEACGFVFDFNDDNGSGRVFGTNTDGTTLYAE